MVKKLITMAAAALLITAVACGSDNSQPQTQAAKLATIVPAPPVPADNLPVELPTPAQPIQNIEQIAQDQENPAPTQVAAETSGGPQPASQETPEQGQETVAIDVHTSEEMPGQHNEVQLADVYAAMDMNQFAITAEQWEAYVETGDAEASGMPVITERQHLDHPYLHMTEGQTSYGKKGIRFGPTYFLTNS